MTVVAKSIASTNHIDIKRLFCIFQKNIIYKQNIAHAKLNFCAHCMKRIAQSALDLDENKLR